MSIYIYDEPEITNVLYYATMVHSSMTWIVRKDLNNLGNGQERQSVESHATPPLCNNTMVVEWINNDNHY